MKAVGGRRKGGREAGREEVRRKTSWEPVPLWADPHAGTPPPPWACSAVTHPALVVGVRTGNMTEPPHVPDV